jgi:two-component system chemotaxis sensor kinase CheA
MTNMDAVLRAYIEETSENLETLDHLLLELETSHEDSELMQQLMRTAHNVKGSAATASLTATAELVHEMENGLHAMGEWEERERAELLDQLFASVDVLRATLEELREGRGETGELSNVTEDLRRLIETSGKGSGPSRQPDGGSMLGGVSLGEYDVVRIGVLRKQGKHLYRLEASFEDGGDGSSGADGVRSFLRNLRKTGDVVATFPPETVLEEGAEVERLVVVYGSKEKPECLREELGEQASVEVEIAELSEDDLQDEDAQPRPAPNRQSRPHRYQDWVKVDLERIDRLVDIIGELVVVETMVMNAPEVESITSQRVRNYLNQLTRTTRELQDLGMAMRMVPLRGVFRSMARMVRDISRKQGKKLDLVISGGETEIDRNMVERIHDPLVHLIRNGIDHGIEPADERAEKGKPATGTIRLSASQKGGSIVIEVSDDGRGLDREAILASARKRGLLNDESSVSEAELFNAIFTPGFTTVGEVTDLSGRGVGLDVVKRNVESLRGQITVHSEPGQSTTFQLTLPITLAIIDGMLLSCGPERYVLPTRSIIESVQPEDWMVLTQGGRLELLRLRGEVMPLMRLGRLFDIPGHQQDPTRALVIVVETSMGKAGLMVDDVVSQQQVVIKNISAEFPNTHYLSGAAILPNGLVGLILNVDEIIKLENGPASMAECAKASSRDDTGLVTPF